MTEVRATRRVRLLPFAVDSVLLAGMLLTTVGHSGTPVVTGLSASAVPHVSTNDSRIEFAVDPPSFWMRSGGNVTLEAVWSTGSPLCNVTPLWYRWSSGGGNATGFLNSAGGPSTTFTADSFGSGTVSVITRSGAVLDCGGDQTIVERSAGANLSIVVPLSLSGVELGPNPLLPGENATFVGRVVGGEPPYALAVAWGDGTRSTLTLSGPGTFSIDHRFPAGEFVPSVLATDSAGDSDNTSVEEAVSVGTGLEVGIIPASYVAEVGVPVEFTGVVEGQSSGSITLFDCSNATVKSGTQSASPPNETTFSCVFATPGTAVVLFGVYPSEPGGPSASVVLYEPVVALPRVAAGSVAPVGEDGGTTSVRVDVTGGVLPIVLSWNLSGNRSGGEETVWSDGGGVIAPVLGVAGDYVIGVRVTDSLGSVDVSSTAALQVDAPLESNASGASRLLAYGATADVSGVVASGCPPFLWWVVPDLVPSNESVANGTLVNVGEFAWSGSYAREGNLSVTAGVVDDCGATWQTGFVVPLVPPPLVDVTAGQGPASSNETLAVNLSVQDGMPPFRLTVNASDNESWNRTVLSDGTYRWLFPSHGNGSLEVAITVSDRLGGDVGTTLTVVLVRPTGPTVPPLPAPAPPPPTAPGSSGNMTASSTATSGWLLAVVLIPGGVGATVLFRRWRRARKNPRVVPGPDPVATLKRIIEPADGAERFTVELLAEEAGLSLAVVRSTIDRLVSEGTVHSESGADGEEVLSWSSQPGH